MIDWKSLIPESTLATLLGRGLGRYQRAIHSGLLWFLGELPAARQRAIVGHQTALPPCSTAAQRLGRLALSCPVLHKLGQILARDERLDPELRAHLQLLESLPSSIPIEGLHRLVERELGSTSPIQVEPPALAEASVAVVVPFRGVARGAPASGVLKLLKPGVEENLEEELEVLGRLGAYLDESCESLGIPPLDYEELFENLRAKLSMEVRLDQEQRHLDEARHAHASNRRVWIPERFDFCTPKLTAMERVRGVKVTDFPFQGSLERRFAAELLVESLIARPIFSRESLSMIHGDPHAGNLFWTEDHRLAILDWSLVGHLGERERAGVSRILLAASVMDGRWMSELVEGLMTDGIHDPAALQAVVADNLRQIRQGGFPGFSWLLNLLDEVASSVRGHPSADLLLFRKSMHQVQQVVSAVSAGPGLIDEVLARWFLAQLAGEWPTRWFRELDSHAFPTGLSNADLLRWMRAVPWTAARYWLETAHDLLNPR